MLSIEREAATAGPLPPAPPKPVPVFTVASLVGPALLPSMVVGSVVLIVINTVIFGFVQWLPTFFVQQGMSITKSFGYTLVIILGSPFGCALGAFGADYWGRKPSIIGAAAATIVLGAIYPFVHAPVLVLSIGFLLIVAIYVQVAILFGVYTPELFPTKVRLRANGICNTIGRAATIASPFVVLALFRAHGVTGVLGLVIGLLAVQIVVVAVWGIEPANRGLEELETATGRNRFANYCARVSLTKAAGPALCRVPHRCALGRAADAHVAMP
jgi:putative MFS transporter